MTIDSQGIGAHEKSDLTDQKPESAGPAPGKMITAKNMALGSLLVVALWIASWPVINGRFIWHDWRTLINNVLVTSKTGISQVWYSPTQLQFQPLAKSLLWVEYRFFGPSPLGYHVVSLLLTSIVVMLLWRLLTRLGIPGAFIAALVFAVHPLTLQTTAYISQTGNILALGFLLGALWCWIEHLDSPDQRFYLASFGLMVAALLSRPMLAACAPLLLLLVGWWRKGRIDLRMLRELLPMVVFAAATTAVALWFFSPLTAQVELPLSVRLVMCGWAFWFYLSKLFWPMNLNLIYKPWPVASVGFWAYLPLVLMAAVFVTLWVWPGRRAEKSRRAILLGIGFYVLALLPVSGVIKLPWMLYTSAATPLAYVASVGLIALVCAGLAQWHDRLKLSGRIVMEIAAAAVLVLLAVVTNLHARLYQTPVQLWKTTLHHNPQAWPAHNNLARIAVQQHPPRLFTARRECQQAIRINPNDFTARLLLAKLDFKLGDTKSAMAQLHEILKRDKNNARALDALSQIAMTKGDFTVATVYAQAAVKSDPTSGPANLDMGDILAHAGDMHNAVKFYLKALSASPRNAAVRVALAAALLHLGKIKPAIIEYRNAVALDPLNIPLRFAYARLLAKSGLLDQANAQFHKLIKLRPNRADLHEAFGAFLLQNHVYRRAKMELQAAIKIDPHNAATWLQLADVLRREGQKSQAEACTRKAQEINAGSMIGK